MELGRDSDTGGQVSLVKMFPFFMYFMCSAFTLPNIFRRLLVRIIYCLYLIMEFLNF